MVTTKILLRVEPVVGVKTLYTQPSFHVQNWDCMVSGQKVPNQNSFLLDFISRVRTRVVFKENYSRWQFFAPFVLHRTSQLVTRFAPHFSCYWCSKFHEINQKKTFVLLKFFRLQCRLLKQQTNHLHLVDSDSKTLLPFWSFALGAVIGWNICWRQNENQIFNLCVRRHASAQDWYVNNSPLSFERKWELLL